MLYLMSYNSLSRILTQTPIRMGLRQMKETINWNDTWSSPDGPYWNSQGWVQECVSDNDNSVFLSRLLTNFHGSHGFPSVLSMQTRLTGLYPHTRTINLRSHTNKSQTKTQESTYTKLDHSNTDSHSQAFRDIQKIKKAGILSTFASLRSFLSGSDHNFLIVISW